MGFDTAYEALTEENDARWAFGTDFDDPLSGMDAAVPPGIPADELAAYCLMLADDALVMSQRLQQWCTRAPELEDEVALANIALDLLGQARLLLARSLVAGAGSAAEGALSTEDELAFLREASDYRNVALVERPNGDFAETTVRLLAFSTWKLAVFSRLRSSADPVIAAIAAKAVKELTYHREYAAAWVIRLGDGTEESRRRVEGGLATVSLDLAELFREHPVELALRGLGVAVDPAAVREEFDSVIDEVLAAATVAVRHDGAGHFSDDAAASATATALDGRNGRHSAALAELLDEMQSVARANPGATW